MYSAVAMRLSMVLLAVLWLNGGKEGGYFTLP